ncbi:MAG TPA: hypothetical protein VFV67_09280 [Actinophytocola sp.]|uniref:hypothetical protein n=1 Tax=Actinophytocola sp. TaxID=1872138 RepID=UPI002DBBA860|nr:hypothetical protein [Actinophytocola sp.]HEU5470833.1 hypothetical protein [Actinophytocola sp.]
MDRRRLRKISVAGAALVLIGTAVFVLRDPEPGQRPRPPGQQTTVRAFAAPSVIVPSRGARPKPPRGLDIRAGSHRLVAGWAEPAAAAGYEVRWGPDGRPDRTRLVAEPVIQLDGLDNGTRYGIEVRAVDEFGQRSDPVRGLGTPAQGLADLTPYTFVDRFNDRSGPDPARWRLVGVGDCTRAARGDGEDAHRMVLVGGCGDSDEAVALRSRTPLRLRQPAAAPDGELGRFVVQTDRPGQAGELTLDLVPGPVDLIGRQPDGAPVAAPGRATVDDSLPPGTIRVAILGQPAATVVRVLVPPGTPVLGRPVAVRPLPAPRIGLSVRWEVVLRTDGVRVLRDGEVVGGGDVVPTFTEATALVGLAGGRGAPRVAVDLIGFSGAPTATPAHVPPPRIDFERVAIGPDRPVRTTGSGRTISEVHSGQLRITLVPQREQPQIGDQFSVDVGGNRYPARPAVPGQPMRPGVRLPVVADLPGEALILDQSTGAVAVAVHSAVEEDGLATQVLSAELELTGEDRPAPPDRAGNRPLPRPRPVLAEPDAVLLDGGGTPIPVTRDAPRGRLVVEVTTDAAGAQQRSGAVAGLAGIEISLDRTPLAGIPTAADGPGIGGRWRIAIDTSRLAAGSHTIQVLAVGTDPATAFAVSYIGFVLP